MPIKVSMIGAGSIGFTRRLIRDILSVPELQDTIFSLTDISKDNLEKVTNLCRRDVADAGLPSRILSTTNRRRALADADYVICMIRQGGLEAFATDIEIPLRYGIDQCVGDTLCAGGIFYAQRTIPVLLDFCRDIREVSKPGALFMNYANPMAMNTWACNQYGGVQTVGLCHGVQGAHWQITQVIEHWAKQSGQLQPDEKLPKKDVHVVAAGLNHQTWFIHVRWNGIDFVPLLPDLFPQHPQFSRTEKVRIDVLRRFGFYSTESNGHLSEYLPWYRKRPAEIRKWVNLESWINGETGGYLRVCTEGRNWFETDYPNWLKEPAWNLAEYQRSEEHGSYIIEALQTGRTYRGHFNVMNHGQIPNLPEGCCVEIPGYVDRTGIHIPVVGPLPMACAATCSVSANVQKMGMEAAVHGNVQLLKQALLHDPLTGAICNPEEIWQMADEMLVAQSQWLPQYSSGIPPAQARLARHVAEGTRVKLRKSWKGAARKRTRSIEEMAKDSVASRKAAAASDKGNMTKSS